MRGVVGSTSSSRFSSIPENKGQVSKLDSVFDLRSYRLMEVGAFSKNFLLSPTRKSLGESFFPTAEAVIFDYVVS